MIATDADGRITFLNPVAETLTGWSREEALGQPVQSVFRIVDETTRIPGEDIVGRVLREGAAVKLANNTCLIARAGQANPHRGQRRSHQGQRRQGGRRGAGVP